MLTKVMIQEIQDLKLRGYTKSDIVDYYKSQGMDPPSLPTIRKYYDMDVVPDDPGKNLEKDKAFDHEPFRSVIIEILRNNAGNSDLYISSVYDVLEEKFIDSGEYEKLPGNPQTLRNYIHYLRRNGTVMESPKNTRIYDHVFDTPPGEQMLIDFGQVNVSGRTRIHFICLLMRYSRLLMVYAQDHKFSSIDACRAIYRSFCRMDGRAKELVIDQDAVFVNTETYGEVIKTQVFEDFCTEQGLKLWVCHKADPESKGPIENSVKFCKTNFFSARKTKITCIDDVWRMLPGWLDRKNKRIHQSTYCVPVNVFNSIEKAALRPLIPSLYEDSPNSFTEYPLKSIPYIQYKTNKYSVPRDCCFHPVYYKVVGRKLHIYDAEKVYLCTHDISELHGQTFQLPEHKRKPDERWLPIVERLRGKWNCTDFQHFVNGVKKENPRYLTKQFSLIEDYLEKEAPDRRLVAKVMTYCCEHYRYQFGQFSAVFEAMKPVKPLDGELFCSDVQKKDLGTYQKAFDDRVATAGGKAAVNE
jgi:transposase